MAGDELIYCIDVRNRKEVYDNLLAFFKTLRFFDKQYFKKGSYIRLQGSAWTAGFPIRNRIMTPITSASEKCKNTEDYMGPEIDIGFRIGKYTFAGIIVVSLELAYILLDTKFTLQTTERIRVIDTGWEVLKGVWEGKRYPIFWLDLLEQYDTNGKEIGYTPYTQWDIEENKHVKNYAAAKENSKYERDSDLRSIIQSLPKSFDVNIPYFITDEEEFPPEHQERLKFINIVNEVTQTNKEQNKSKKKSKNMNSRDKIMKLVDGALTKNRHPDN